MTKKILEFADDSGAVVPASKKRRDTLSELEALKAQERIDAITKPFEPQPSDAWKTTKAWWQTASEEDRQNMVYTLAYEHAAKLKLIARYYNIDVKSLDQYKQIWDMGDAARILKINGHQLNWAYTTNVPNAKFFMGLQFAGQVQNPSHEGVESLDEHKEHQVNITVISKDKPAEADTQVEGTDSVSYGVGVLQ